MKRPHNRQRIVAMHQMLFEMARGDFNTQVPASGLDDELETLLVLLNMVAEELRESALFSGYLNPHGSQVLVSSATLILDDQYRIVNADGRALELLGYEANEILGRPIAELLGGGTKAYGLLKGLHSGEKGAARGRAALHFTSGGRLSHTLDCTLERLADGKGWVLGCLVPFLRKDAFGGQKGDRGTQKAPYPRKSDARLVQKVYDYILGQLEGPLPSVKELAHMFGTNEFKLKEGFRHFLHTSIYQFYTEERLKRARLMIEESDLPLKSIAQKNGFNSYPNFSKSFKRRFGLSPAQVKRGS